MTEFEALDLANQYINETNQLQFGYFSILSAFLVMSYLVADKLNYVLIVIVLALFSVFILNFIAQIYGLNAVLDSLLIYISEQKEAGSYDLEWWGDSGGLVTPVMYTIIQSLSTFGGYVGAIAFFFYHRHRKLSERTGDS
jgi:mannose/fructose/N-acetylgalactosamine-specific phosphotransferase system component IID